MRKVLIPVEKTRTILKSCFCFLTGGKWCWMRIRCCCGDDVTSVTASRHISCCFLWCLYFKNTSLVYLCSFWLHYAPNILFSGRNLSLPNCSFTAEWKSGFIELSEFLSHQSPLMLDSAVDMVDSLLAQFLVSTNTFPHQLVSNSVLFPLVSVQCYV